MISNDLKYCKLKNLNDVDFIFDSYQRNELENFSPQILEDLFRNKQRVVSVLNSSIQEYFQRVTLEKEISTLHKQQTSVSHKLSELHKKLKIMKEEKENEDFCRNMHRILLYEQNLAIRIKPSDLTIISEGEVAVSIDFHHISESKPEETCTFVLIITDSNKYKASSCYPPIEAMEELISRLNKTNDLHQFITSVRKEFRKYFLKSV